MNAKARIQAQLSAYLDGELDEAQLRQVEEALESDGGLRAELAELSAARKLLRDLPAEKPPADLVSRVLAEAERSQLVGGQSAESGPSPLRWIRYAASAAVLLVAATVGMVIAITLCSPEMYKDTISRHRLPDVRDDKTNLAVANGKRTGGDEDVDRESLGRLAMRARSMDDRADGGEWKEGGGGGSGGHGLDGKLGKPDDNGRSGKPGPGGPEASNGAFTVSGGAFGKSNAGNLTKGGEGDLSGGNTYNGDTAIDGTLAKNSAGTLSLSGVNTYGGGNTYDGGNTISAGTLGKSGAGTLGTLAKGVNSGGYNLNGYVGTGLGDNNNDAVTERFDNVKTMSRVLAGDMTNNTIIYTDRLDQTQRQVETVLNANGIAPMMTRQSGPLAAQNKAGGNVYVSNTLSPAQVQYEAYVTPEQMAKVQKALDSLRARQNVSQDVPALAYNGASAKGGGWGHYNQRDQAGKDGEYIAGKESEKQSGVAIASADGDRGRGWRSEAQKDATFARASTSSARTPEPTPAAAPGERAAKSAASAPEPVPAARPAPPPAPAVSATVVPAMEPDLAAKPAPAAAAVAPAPVASKVEPAPPAPVVAVTGRCSGEEAAGRKYKQDARPADKLDTPLAKGLAKVWAKPVEAPAKPGDKPAEEAAKPGDKMADGAEREKTQLAKAPAKPEPKQAQAPARPEAQLANAPDSGSGSATAHRGQTKGDLLRDTDMRREVAQTQPAITVERIASADRPRVTTPSDPSEAAQPASAPAANRAATAGRLAESEGRFSKDMEQRPAGQGQVTGPMGGQYAAGTPNPPTAPPAQPQAPAEISQGEQIVRVGVVRQSPPAGSGGTVVVQLAAQPGQAGRVEDNPATARVQRLVITLNYRPPGEAGVNLDRASLNAAASQSAPKAAPAADMAQEESKTQQSK